MIMHSLSYKLARFLCRYKTKKLDRDNQCPSFCGGTVLSPWGYQSFVFTRARAPEQPVASPPPICSLAAHVARLFVQPTAAATTATLDTLTEGLPSAP